MSFGKRIKELRERLGLNQKEFSKRIGIPPTTYRGYEISSSTPNAEVLARICKQFNVNPSWLLLGEGLPWLKNEKLTQCQLNILTCGGKRNLNNKIIKNNFSFFDNEETHLISERIKFLRKVLKLTQREFAKELGVSKSSIQLYETAKSIPSAQFLGQIYKQFNVNAEWLLTGEGSPFRETKQASEYSPYEMILSDILHRIGYYETDFTPKQLAELLKIIEKEVKSALWDTQSKIFSLIRSWGK